MFKFKFQEQISCLFFDRKNVGRLYDTINVREHYNILEILTLRISDVAVINSGVSY